MVVFLKITYYYNILRGRQKIKQIKKWINFCDITLLSENCIGGIKLGDDVTVGANAFVNKSFDKNNIKLVGIPAHII